jgi:large subunit ribosomal protein L20
VASRRRRRKILDQAKGYWGRRKNVYTVAKNAVEKALQYQYRDRKVRKREFRKLWITRINAAARLNGTTYSRLMGALNKKNVEINRKVLADLAVNDPETFAAIAEEASK